MLTMVLASKGQDIYIEKIEVSSKYNSTYILSYANVFLFKVKYVDRQKINDVVKELKLSGLFKEINWNLAKIENEESYSLKIKPEYKDNFEDIIIDDVNLDDFPEINKSIFLDKLAKRDILMKSTWVNYSFSNLVGKIKIALQESSNLNLYKDTPEVPWVTIRESSPNKIKLIVHNSSYDPFNITNANK